MLAALICEGSTDQIVQPLRGKSGSSLSLGGQEGLLRSSRKWMIQLTEEFAFGVVRRVYLSRRRGAVMTL
jgi:hypothetical protein